MTLTPDAVINIVYAFVILAIIQQVGAYAMLRLFITGKPWMQRRAEIEEPKARPTAVRGVDR